MPDWQAMVAAAVPPGLLLAWYLWTRRIALLWGAMVLALATALLGPVYYTVICGQIQKPHDWPSFWLDLGLGALAAVLLLTRRRR